MLRTCLGMSNWKVWHSQAVPAATLVVAASKTTTCKAIISVNLITLSYNCQ